MSSLLASRRTESQPLTVVTQAACLGKEMISRPGWAWVSAKEASSLPGPPTIAPPAQPPPAASRSPLPSP